jgi:hypothetical protein
LLACLFGVFGALAVFAHSGSAGTLTPCPVVLALSRPACGGHEHTFFSF